MEEPNLWYVMAWIHLPSWVCSYLFLCLELALLATGFNTLFNASVEKQETWHSGGRVKLPLLG